MKKLLPFLILTIAASISAASDFVVGSGAIAVGGNFGVFAAAGAADGVRFKGSGSFAELRPNGQVVRKVVMLRSTSLTIANGTLTMGGPAFVWTLGGWTLSPVTFVLTDSPSGDTFSITVGPFIASGPLLRGRVVSGSN